MQKYINQLLADIKAATFDEAEQPPNFETLEEDFAEVERYIYEVPSLTLGVQIGLDKIQFPPCQKLTVEQAEQVIEALAWCYYSHGVSLGVPERLPTEIMYQTYVAALDRMTFLSYSGGNITFEYCPYDNRYCPFKLERCPCWEDWLKNAKQLSVSSFEELHYMEKLDVLYYNLLQFYQQVRRAFIAADMPHKTYVFKIILQIETLRKRMRQVSYSFRYIPPEETDNFDYRQLSEWLDLPAFRFPKYKDLQPLEREIIVLALAQLYGEEALTFRILSQSAADRYRILTTIFTAPMNYELCDEGNEDEDRLLSVAPGYLNAIYKELEGKYPLFDFDYSSIKSLSAGDSLSSNSADWSDDLPF